MQLKGRRIIVTGGASGIGLATVRAYVREGAKVAVLDINDAAGQAVAKAAAAAGPGSTAYYHCDVSSEGEVNDAFAQATAWMGGLDVLANPAGVLGRTAADEITVAEWNRVFDVNVTGTLLTNQAAFRAMKGNGEGGGRIINFGSGAGLNAYVGGGHYSASKGAVMSWTRTIAHEWAPYWITCNSVVPSIMSPMFKERLAEMTPEARAAYIEGGKKRYPLGGTLGDADRDMAPVMVFLAGEGSRFITGQLIAVTGGSTMVR